MQFENHGFKSKYPSTLLLYIWKKSNDHTHFDKPKKSFVMITNIQLKQDDESRIKHEECLQFKK